MIKLLLTLIFTSILSASVFAKGNFADINPDGGKYEFTRSFISALSYLKKINDRWEKSPKSVYPNQTQKMIRLNIDYLIQDNVDLRIAKNYMVKYFQTGNPLMKKASDELILSCDRQIEINNQERLSWEDWGRKLSENPSRPQEERVFVNRLASMAQLRKQALALIIKATELTKIVLKSQKNADEKGVLLSLTQKQRNKLIDKVDEFAHDYNEWGVKQGQSSIQAAISMMREILEDSYYTDLGN